MLNVLVVPVLLAVLMVLALPAALVVLALPAVLAVLAVLMVLALPLLLVVLALPMLLVVLALPMLLVVLVVLAVLAVLLLRVRFFYPRLVATHVVLRCFRWCSPRLLRLMLLVVLAPLLFVHCLFPGPRIRHHRIVLIAGFS